MKGSKLLERSRMKTLMSTIAPACADIFYLDMRQCCIDAVFLQKARPVPALRVSAVRRLLLGRRPPCSRLGATATPAPSTPYNRTPRRAAASCGATTAATTEPAPSTTPCSSSACAALARPAVSSCETGGAGTSSWRSAYLEWRRPILHDPSAYAVCTPQLAVPAGFAQAAAPYAEAGRIDARQPREF